jgi:hypothetical protein
MLGEDITATQI